MAAGRVGWGPWPDDASPVTRGDAMRKPYLVALVLAPVVPLAALIGRHAEDIAMLSVRPAVVATVATVARRPPQPARVASRPQPPPPPLPPPPPRRLLRSPSPSPCADDPG